ncbi:MAG: hypothetical protein A2Y24_01110 [Clostridiales bacterium GWE2_32_10]|nr:MAG: hypothetical protein A2Y24_01110 [Clostridiales bacterium GWE2_32_10]HBY21212.1 type III toxin-antitoxin system ToxN/AbiQ family toxin [Clostridiales bacterium]
MNRLEFYNISAEYVEYLRNFDSKVSHMKDSKKHRPFVGIILDVDGIRYFAPLSSPKEKHKNMKNKQDFIKIEDGKLGAINFNNMIPVHIECCKIIDTNNIQDFQYKTLLRNQLTWCNLNKEKLINLAHKLHRFIINNKVDEKLQCRCCDFRLLEEKCREYR